MYYRSAKVWPQWEYHKVTHSWNNLVCPEVGHFNLTFSGFILAKVIFWANYMLSVCVCVEGEGGWDCYFLGVRVLVPFFSNRCVLATLCNFTVGELGIGPHNLHGSCAVPWETSVAISTKTTNKSLILHCTTGTVRVSVQWRKGTHAGHNPCRLSQLC